MVAACFKQAVDEVIAEEAAANAEPSVKVSSLKEAVEVIKI